MTPVRLEPAAPRSRVKHSTTEPLRSQDPACQMNLDPRVVLDNPFLFLFVFLLYVLVNSYGYGGMVSSPNHTFFSWASLNKNLTSTSCVTDNNPS